MDSYQLSQSNESNNSFLSEDDSLTSKHLRVSGVSETSLLSSESESEDKAPSQSSARFQVDELSNESDDSEQPTYQHKIHQIEQEQQHIETKMNGLFQNSKIKNNMLSSQQEEGEAARKVQEYNWEQRKEKAAQETDEYRHYQEYKESVELPHTLPPVAPQQNSQQSHLHPQYMPVRQPEKNQPQESMHGRDQFQEIEERINTLENYINDKFSKTVQPPQEQPPREQEEIQEREAPRESKMRKMDKNKKIQEITNKYLQENKQQNNQLRVLQKQLDNLNAENQSLKQENRRVSALEESNQILISKVKQLEKAGRKQQQASVGGGKKKMTGSTYIGEAQSMLNEINSKDLKEVKLDKEIQLLYYLYLICQQHYQRHQEETQDYHPEEDGETGRTTGLDERGATETEEGGETETVQRVVETGDHCQEGLYLIYKHGHKSCRASRWLTWILVLSWHKRYNQEEWARKLTAFSGEEWGMLFTSAWLWKWKIFTTEGKSRAQYWSTRLAWKTSAAMTQGQSTWWCSWEEDDWQRFTVPSFWMATRREWSALAPIAFTAWRNSFRSPVFFSWTPSCPRTFWHSMIGTFASCPVTITLSARIRARVRLIWLMVRECSNCRSAENRRSTFSSSTDTTSSPTKPTPMIALPCTVENLFALLYFPFCNLNVSNCLSWDRATMTSCQEGSMHRAVGCCCGIWVRMQRQSLTGVASCLREKTLN